VQSYEQAVGKVTWIMPTIRDVSNDRLRRIERDARAGLSDAADAALSDSYTLREARQERRNREADS